MPLTQQLILYLGHAPLSFIIVPSALVLFSVLGGLLAHRVPLRVGVSALILTIAGYQGILPWLFQSIILLAFPARLAIAVACLLPLALLAGIHFAGGMRRVEGMGPRLPAWIWAINGSVSVISCVLATILALCGGCRAVFALAAACYLGGTLAFCPLTGLLRSTASS